MNILSSAIIKMEAGAQIKTWWQNFPSCIYQYVVTALHMVGNHMYVEAATAGSCIWKLECTNTPQWTYFLAAMHQSCQ